jgi:hypothetical protein
MTPKHWTLNLNNNIGTIPNHQIIKTIFSSILDLTIMNNWKGACHESCGAIHILLNETGVTNTWCIGEAQVGQAFFDHSWIEINSEIFDIAICNPLQPAFKSGPVIKGIDIDTNLPTTALYGVVSGHPDDPMTAAVKSLTLSNFLANSPIHPTLGTWLLIDQVATHKLKKTLNIASLMTKYQGQYFTTRP